MCEKCGNLAVTHAGSRLDRRSLLLGGGAVAAAAPFVAIAASDAQAQPVAAKGMTSSKARAFAASSADGEFRQIEITRRAVGAKDIAIDILFADICHSDIHTVKGDWGKPSWPGKPGAVISLAPGALGAFGANHHLRQSLVFLDVPTLQQPEAYLGHAGQMFDADGGFADSGTEKLLKTFLAAFAEWIERTTKTT